MDNHPNVSQSHGTLVVLDFRRLGVYSHTAGLRRNQFVDSTVGKCIPCPGRPHGSRSTGCFSSYKLPNIDTELRRLVCPSATDHPNVARNFDYEFPI